MEISDQHDPHGVDGFLHTPGDPESLAIWILQLDRRPELAGPAAERNRGKVVISGDRETNMGRLEQIYRELIDAGRAA